MECLTTNDTAMKALRAHCLEIEPESPAAESAHTEPEDSYNWFHIEPPTHAERYPTRPLNQRSNNEEEIHNEWWTRNGKVDAAAAVQIAKEKEKVARGNKSPSIDQLIKAELDDIRAEVHRRRRRKAKEQEQEQPQPQQQQKQQHNRKQQQQQQSKTVKILETTKRIQSMKGIEGVAAKSVAMDEARKQLEKAHDDYERAYEENLKELEYGPGCACLRYPWQCEVLPPKAMWGARWGAGKRKLWEGKVRRGK